MGKSVANPVPSPVRELRLSLGLNQEQFAARVGRSRATIADAEQMRRESPPMVLFKRLLRLGLIPNVEQFAAQYRVARAGLGPEWLANSNPKANLPATSPLAPSNPMQQFLDLNGLTVASLCRRIGAKHRPIADKILDRRATAKAASVFFQTLRWGLPLEWAQSAIHDRADEMYRIVVEYYRERDANGWQTYLTASQPREAGE